jgi:uncharacterized protein YgiM (DUF1202 family)
MPTIAILALILLSLTSSGFAKDFPDTTSVEPFQGRFTLQHDSWAYKRPSIDADQLKQVHTGHHVIVTGATKDFVQVHLSDGSTGYIPLAVVKLFRPADKMLTLSSDARVYAGPHHGNAKLATVHRGQSVHVIGVELSYLKIRTDDGAEGFIPVSTVR